jgi:hypothetical protein
MSSERLLKESLAIAKESLARGQTPWRIAITYQRLIQPFQSPASLQKADEVFGLLRAVEIRRKTAHVLECVTPDDKAGTTAKRIANQKIANRKS